MQPTGELHIGNYIGALKNWIELSEKYPSLFAIVDLHAITIPYNPAEMQDRIIKVAVDFIASGLDPNKTHIFVQSSVRAHTELQWILSTVTNTGDLFRMTQYKEKSQRQENPNAGLLCYPILQAADILLYDANRVPVGEDQLQHLELTREIARNFNRRFNTQIFVEPQPVLSPYPRIKGLDGKAKMSKSLNNHIALSDPPEVVEQKIKKAFTLEQRQRKSDPGEPELCNIFTLHKIFTKDKETINKIAEGCRTAQIGCVECKRILIKSLNEELAPIREKRQELLKDTDYVIDVLKEGAKYANELANKKMDEVYNVMGLRRF